MKTNHLSFVFPFYWILRKGLFIFISKIKKKSPFLQLQLQRWWLLLYILFKCNLNNVKNQIKRNNQRRNYIFLHFAKRKLLWMMVPRPFSQPVTHRKFSCGICYWDFIILKCFICLIWIHFICNITTRHLTKLFSIWNWY